MAKISKDSNKSRRPARADRPFKAAESGSSLGGFLGKLGTLVEKLGELAEAGQELSRSGEIQDSSGKVRGVYGFTVKTGLGDQGQPQLKVEPFGNVGRRPAGQAPVDEVREPPVDVYEEEDHVLVVAEIPGVSKKDVRVELCGNRLVLSAQSNDIRYHKEVVLPEQLATERMRWACKNGILSVRIER